MNALAFFLVRSLDFAHGVRKAVDLEETWE